MKTGVELVLIAHNIRSTHNVGSLFRTADAMKVKQIFLTGYTPHPSFEGDPRLPHEGARQARQIKKTALGAESYVSWKHYQDVATVIDQLRLKGYQICALEQNVKSIPLPSFITDNKKVAIVIGNEVDGITRATLVQCDVILEIPMLSNKESLNVVQATAMALYHLRFMQ